MQELFRRIFSNMHDKRTRCFVAPRGRRAENRTRQLPQLIWLSGAPRLSRLFSMNCPCFLSDLFCRLKPVDKSARKNPMEKWKREFIRYLFPYSASRLRIEPAYVVKHPHVPPLLHKYRQFSGRHKDALAKGVLWMSSPDKFNDPYDSGVWFDPDRFLVEDQSAHEFIKTAKEMQAAISSGAHWVPKPVANPIQQGKWRRKIAHDLLRSEPAAGRDALLVWIESYFNDQAEQGVRRMSKAFREEFGVLCLAENSTSVQIGRASCRERV